MVTERQCAWMRLHFYAREGVMWLRRATLDLKSA
jgi:hypothetical protein